MSIFGYYFICLMLSFVASAFIFYFIFKKDAAVSVASALPPQQGYLGNGDFDMDNATETRLILTNQRS